VPDRAAAVRGEGGGCPPPFVESKEHLGGFAVVDVADEQAALLGTVSKHHHAPGGLYERIFLGLELLWITVAAVAIIRQAPATGPE
jgi:hypothetical protein